MVGRKYISLVLLPLMAFPAGCDGCHCNCDGDDGRRTLLVQAVMPEGHSASSFCLRHGVNERMFYGDSVKIVCNDDYVDMLIYNNDGDAVIVKDDVAFTNNTFGSDTLFHQPSPFYSLYRPDIHVADKDSLQMHLTQRAFDYGFEVVLKNNDGRISRITQAVVSGMAKGLDLIDGRLLETAAYLMEMSGDASSATGTIRSFGPGGSEQYLTLVFTRNIKKTDVYSLRITEQMRPLTRGGTLTIVIDVEADIPVTGTGGGFNVGLVDWKELTHIKITL